MSIAEINQLNWVDSFLSDISIKSNNIQMRIIAEGSVTYKILFAEYIAFEYIGHWDESIIESIQANLQGELIEKALVKVKKNYSDTEIPFCEKHLNDLWIQTNIKIIDGGLAKIVCKDILVEVTSE